MKKIFNHEDLLKEFKTSFGIENIVDPVMENLIFLKTFSDFLKDKEITSKTPADVANNLDEYMMSCSFPITDFSDCVGRDVYFMAYGTEFQDTVTISQYFDYDEKIASGEKIKNVFKKYVDLITKNRELIKQPNICFVNIKEGYVIHHTFTN